METLVLHYMRLVDLTNAPVSQLLKHVTGRDRFRRIIKIQLAEAIYHNNSSPHFVRIVIRKDASLWHQNRIDTDKHVET